MNNPVKRNYLEIRSINELVEENKPNENWITTVVNVSYGEGDSETNLQRVLDAQIVEGKIKKVYGYERVISKEEN